MKLEGVPVGRSQAAHAHFAYSYKAYITVAGRGDVLFAFRDEEARRYYLLAENLDPPAHCSVEVFVFGYTNALRTVSLQGDAVVEALGKKGLDYAPRTIIRKLLEGLEG